MTDFPSREPTPAAITSFSTYFAGGALIPAGALTGPALTSWPAANLALYYPFSLPFPYPVRRLMISSGIAGGNWSLGIYDEKGAAIYLSGSISSTASQTAVQYHTVSTATLLEPGPLYYFGCAQDGTSNRANAATFGSLRMQLMGVYEEALGALPLPGQATFTQTTRTIWQFFGITRTP